MNENKKKARPDGDASEQAKMETSRTGKNPRDNFTTAKDPISKYLMEGQENGLHLQDLVRITGWTEREVRQQIHRERRRGIPILSDNANGYFLPANEDEREHCVRSMRHRAAEILRAAAAIEYKANLSGQMTIAETDQALRAATGHNTKP